jgi:hypothetical protein
MPIIIERKNVNDVNPEILNGRTWYYFKCSHPECLNEVKSDIGFTQLHCVFCGNIMSRRNYQQGKAW